MFETDKSIFEYINMLKFSSITVNAEILKTSKNDGAMKLVNDGLFMYLTPDTMTGKEPVWRQGIYFIASTACSMYMNSQPEEKVDESFFKQTVPSEELGMMYAEIARLLRRLNRIIDTGGLFCGRIYSEESTAQLALIGLPSENPAKRTKFFGTLTFGHDRITETIIAEINLEDKEQMIQIYPKSIFYSGRTKNVVKAINSVNKIDLSRNLKASRMTAIINRCLELIYDFELRNKKFVIPEYTEPEITLIRHCAALHEQGVKYSIGPAFVDSSMKDFSTFNEFEQYDQEHLLIDANLTEIPLVDLNEKEWKFIDRYWDKLEVINLSEVFDYQRYGNYLRMKMFENFEIVSSFEKKGDLLRLYITHIIDDQIRGMTILNFNRIDDWNLIGSLKAIRNVFWSNRPSLLPAGISEFKKMSPLYDWTMTQLAGFAITIIKLYTIIHDRPQRTRIVRCNDPVYNKHKRGRKPKEPTEFNVVRILKTVSDAKALIDKQNHRDPSKRREAEYTIESWERIGYTRHYKDGHTVEIKPQICHRRKPLAEKEVHIKL